MTNLTRSLFQFHPFHLVSPSPWPLYSSISMLNLTFSAVLTFHGFISSPLFLYIALISIILCMSLWFRDVISEATYLGNHTLAVQKGLNLGIGLFIVSEIFFFLAIFWAFFHSALSPNTELGAKWPPMGIDSINPFELPLLNTVILLSSGVTVTYAHHSLIQGNRSGALYGLGYTAILAIIFTGLQAIEYTVSSYSISDGTYASCFYFGTGLNLAPTLNLLNRFYSIVTNFKINPHWVTGFCDGEASFSIKIAKDNSRFKSLRTSPKFMIELNEKDKDLLIKIQDFFGVGTIISRIRNGRKIAMYSVQSIKSIKEIIIPHFNKYSLLTQKKEDFRLFCIAVNIIYDKQHKNETELNEILSIIASMNKGLSESLFNIFPGIVPITRNKVYCDGNFNPYWVAGFTDAEGCFYIKISKNQPNKAKPYFSISQDIRDINLLEKLAIYLNCGWVETVKTRPSKSILVVYKFSDIFEKIVPFFYKYSLQGKKRLDYEDFRTVTNIVSENKNLNCKKLENIKDIKNKMNRNR